MFVRLKGSDKFGSDYRDSHFIEKIKCIASLIRTRLLGLARVYCNIKQGRRSKDLLVYILVRVGRTVVVFMPVSSYYPYFVPPNGIS